MANNFVEQLAKLYTIDPKRANWLGVPSVTGTNDFGFIKVRHCEEVIPSTVYRFNFKSAYSSNPSITPVLSRAKITVAGIWIPLSLYVPALRDGAEVKALETDYSFPSLNFDYFTYNQVWNSDKAVDGVFNRRNNVQYIPANSIFTELNMWEPYFTPVSRFVPDVTEDTVYPSAKNAIPLLGYYDFFRHYILNNQQELHPLRVQGLSRRYGSNNVPSTQPPVDAYLTRKSFDTLFANVRRIGNGGTSFSSSIDYPQGDGAFDITQVLSNFYFGPSQQFNRFTPNRKYSTLYGDFPEITQWVYFNDDHFGEVRATYFSDFNTAYLSNENVSYERSTARVIADQTDDGISFTMEQIFAAENVQDFIRRSIFKQNDYASFIDAETGITPPTNLTKPLFLGSVSTWFNFNDVISQAQTSTDGFVEDNTSLGSRASLGFARMATNVGEKSRDFVKFTAKEPGYFMLLEWIVPEVAYWQGYHPMYDKTTLMSLYYPSFDRSGYQDQRLPHLVEMVHNDPNEDLEQYGWWFKALDTESYDISFMQVPAYWEHMAYRNRLVGQMVDNTSYLTWNFHRDYDLSSFMFLGVESNGNIYPNSFQNDALLSFEVTNAYVDPEKFHDIYANVEALDNIQCYYKFNIEKYQPLSHRFLSF